MSTIKKFYPTILGALSLLPMIAVAQDPGQLNSRIEAIRNTLNLVIGILFVLATLVFLWGVIQFIAKAGDEATRNKAKGIMTWGIIGLAVMAAAWGVVNILITYFGAQSTSTINVNPPRVIGQ